MGKPPLLLPEQEHTLIRLGPLVDRHGLYLAGGCAIAHYVQHRPSKDLNLFSQTANLDLPRLRDEALAVLPDARILRLTSNSLRLDVANTPVGVDRELFAPLEPPGPGPFGVPVAGLHDLAAMKLAAASQRGLRRDYWDLYEILHHGIPLGQALDAYAKRYGASPSDLYNVLRALTYFTDDEQEPVMPSGLTKPLWRHVCRFFETAAPKELTARLPRFTAPPRR